MRRCQEATGCFVGCVLMLAHELFVECGVVAPRVWRREKACGGTSLVGVDPRYKEVVPFMQVDYDVAQAPVALPMRLGTTRQQRCRKGTMSLFGGEPVPQLCEFLEGEIRCGQ